MTDNSKIYIIPQAVSQKRTFLIDIDNIFEATHWNVGSASVAKIQS